MQARLKGRCRAELTLLPNCLHSVCQTAVTVAAWPDHAHKLYTCSTVHVMKFCSYVKASDDIVISISLFMTTFIQSCVMFYCSDIGLKGIV